MDRAERLSEIVDLLHRAVAMAREAVRHGDNGHSREAALAMQLEGIAAEFAILARADQ